jgi:hypothetical protein
VASNSVRFRFGRLGAAIAAARDCAKMREKSRREWVAAVIECSYVEKFCRMILPGSVAYNKWLESCSDCA